MAKEKKPLRERRKLGTEAVIRATRKVVPEAPAEVNPDAHLPAVLETDLHEVSVELPDPDPWLELPEGLPFAEWCHAAEVIRPLAQRLATGTEVVKRWNDSILWRLGDVLKYGEDMADAGAEGYEQLSQYTDGDTFGYAAATAQKALSMARGFPPEQRMKAPISYSHHAVVMSMDKEGRKRWLHRALKEGWTVADLRANIRASKPPKEVKEAEEVAEERPQRSVAPFDFTAEELDAAADIVYDLYSLLYDYSQARAADADSEINYDGVDERTRAAGAVVSSLLAAITAMKKEAA